jgi:hypothetical protein
VSALSSKDVPWLTKVKKPSLLATISSKGYLKLAFRQALISPFHSLAQFSLNVQSLFGVPGDFNLGEPPFPYSLLSRYIDGRSGFLVCPATILHVLSPDVRTGPRRRPPEDRLDWQLVLALSIYKRTNRS